MKKQNKSARQEQERQSELFTKFLFPFIDEIMNRYQDADNFDECLKACNVIAHMASVAWNSSSLYYILKKDSLEYSDYKKNVIEKMTEELTLNIDMQVKLMDMFNSKEKSFNDEICFVSETDVYIDQAGDLAVSFDINSHPGLLVGAQK